MFAQSSRNVPVPWDVKVVPWTGNSETLSKGCCSQNISCNLCLEFARLVRMPKWKETGGLIDCSYTRNHILWDTYDPSGWFNLSATSKQAWLGWNQGTDHAKGQNKAKVIKYIVLSSSMAPNTYCFLLS